jgi:cyclic pyranopterin phosphate synthase
MVMASHLDSSGKARMVDVGNKDITRRMARAAGEISLGPAAMETILTSGCEKGDVICIAKTAGIMAAKKTGSLIPLCHPLGIDTIDVDFEIDREASVIRVTSRVCTSARTGIEMEALLAVSIALLTVYDMLKALDKEMVISKIGLLEKIGGKSGHFISSKIL